MQELNGGVDRLAEALRHGEGHLMCILSTVFAFLFSCAVYAETQYQHALPFVPNADSVQQGFVRIINQSGRSGTVRIYATDDTGGRFGPVELDIGAHQTRHFNSRDLERGASSKGLARGIGDGEGHWRLELQTSLDIKTLAYIRTPDGFLTSMHDVVSEKDDEHHVTFFNPASNQNKHSLLRIVNTNSESVGVSITGRDDAGRESARAVDFQLSAGEARMIDAARLEQNFGDGTGKWQVFVSATQPIWLMNLLQTRTGHLANLSTEGLEPFVPAPRPPSQPACSGPTVNIPDLNLRRLIESYLRKAPGTPVTPEEMLRTGSSIYGDNLGISNLQGLECAISVFVLSLDGNQITDLSPLAGMTWLRHLSLRNNQVMDLSPLAGMTRLRYLYLDRNQVTDLMPLAGLLSQQFSFSAGELSLGFNQITDLSPLAGYRFLVLDLLHNQITDIAPLARMRVGKLHIKGNPICDAIGIRVC